MWASGDDGPLISIRMIALNFIITAASMVTIVTSNDIDYFIQDTSSGISNPYI